MFARLALTAAVVFASVGPAFAQNAVCRDQNGNVEPNLSAGWQQFQAGASPEAMQQVAGTWYYEMPNENNPAQVGQRYTNFEPNGLFTTQTRVCTNGMMCGDYPGQGMWAAQVQNGVLVIFSIFSDTQVTNYCTISQYQVSSSTMRDQNGITYQRVQ